jgi:hypothetical protein
MHQIMQCRQQRKPENYQLVQKAIGWMQLSCIATWLTQTPPALCLHRRYQFSLAYFTRMFSQCISDSDKSDDVAERLQVLRDYTTAFVFKSVSR